MSEKIAVIGLGYVGLPLLVGLAREGEEVVGFDIDAARVKSLVGGHDWTGEVADDKLQGLKAKLTANAEDMDDCTMYIVTVPTPIDEAKRPDLTPVLGACQTMGALLKRRVAKGLQGKGLVPLITFESTVYPGLTDELCGGEIARLSGCTRGKDFKLGYSPERINPGDKVNRLETIVKVISADDDESLDRLDYVYSKVITAGVHRASSIAVAEAAKVIENTQRDINIALMNELAVICDRMGLRTKEVLEAAGTKWNFLHFMPGLVGGHCIGVDPYYLTARAEELGYHPQVILAGRRINDNMPIFVAQKLVKLMSQHGIMHAKARVGILGLSFKENVRDLRNSRIPEIATELESFGLEVLITDPVADPAHAVHEYGIKLADPAQFKDLDAVVFAVTHEDFMHDTAAIYKMLKPGGVLIDVKSALKPADVPSNIVYWSL